MLATLLVCVTLDLNVVQVQALAGDIVFCSWAIYLTLTVPLSTQVYKWLPTNLMLGGNPAMNKHPIQGGVQNWDEFRPYGPLGLYADLTYLTNKEGGRNAKPEITCFFFSCCHPEKN